jgi:hypothetical protein
MDRASVSGTENASSILAEGSMNIYINYDGGPTEEYELGICTDRTGLPGDAVVMYWPARTLAELNDDRPVEEWETETIFPKNWLPMPYNGRSGWELRF